MGHRDSGSDSQASLELTVAHGPGVRGSNAGPSVLALGGHSAALSSVFVPCEMGRVMVLAFAWGLEKNAPEAPYVVPGPEGTQ